MKQSTRKHAGFRVPWIRDRVLSTVHGTPRQIISGSVMLPWYDSLWASWVWNVFQPAQTITNGLPITKYPLRINSGILKRGGTPRPYDTGTGHMYQLKGVPRQFLKLGKMLCAQCIQGTLHSLSWSREPSRNLAGD